MAESMAVPRRAPQPAPVTTAAPPAVSTVSTVSAGPALQADQRFRMVQLVLFTGGAILMPLGIVAILLGWYGTAHTKYQYDQLPYVVSGGLLGLGLVFLGGFLYFGAWLARSANEQRESARQLADAMHALAAQLGRPGGLTAPGRPIEGAPHEAGNSLVLAGAGSTVHRRDCALIAHRTDLHPLTGTESGLGTCRVCRPDFG